MQDLQTGRIKPFKLESCIASVLLFSSLLNGQAAQTAAGPIHTPPPELAEFFVPPPQYRFDFGQFRSPLLFADGTRVRTRAEWQRRRQEILSDWRQIMGPWPALSKTPLVEVVNATRRESITQQQLRIEIALGGEMVDALLLLPEATAPAKKRPAVLVVYYDAETGAGLAAPFRDYGWQLARRGFVALSIGKPNARIDLASTNPPRSEPYLGPIGEPVCVEPISALAYAAANAHTVLAQRRGRSKSHWHCRPFLRRQMGNVRLLPL